MSENTDFRTPFVAVAIRNSEGKVLPFWQLAEDSDVKSDFPDNAAFAWVQQVTVENQLGDVPILTCLLTPPFREGIEFLDSAFIEYGTSELQIQIGYLDPKIAPQVFTGLLLEPSVTIGEDIQISLNAHGVGGFAAIRNESGRVNNPGETRLELIRRIAAGNGGKAKVTVDDSEVRVGLDLSVGAVAAALGVPSPSTAEDAKKGETAKLLDSPITYSQGGKSDWAALWELVNGANAWMTLVSQADKPGSETKPVLKIMARDKSMAQAPKRILRLYDINEGRFGSPVLPAVVPDIAAGSSPTEYPILSVSNPPGAIYASGTMRALVMNEISDKDPDADNKEVLNHESVSQTRTSEGKAASPDTAGNPDYDADTDEGGARIPGDPELKEAVEAAAMEYRRAGNLGITLEVETLGIPDIAPGETVLLSGIGKRFGTPRWGVHKIVHTVGTGGFTTSLTLVSNADAVLSKGFDPTLDEVNTKEAEGEGGLLAKVGV